MSFRVIPCQICRWFGGSTRATWIGLSSNGKEWYVCEDCKGMERLQLTGYKSLTDKRLEIYQRTPHLPFGKDSN